MFHEAFRAKERILQKQKPSSEKQKGKYIKKKKKTTQMDITTKQWFPNRGDFALPRKQQARSGDMLGCHRWRGSANDVQLVGTRQAANPLQGTVLHNEELPSPHARSAKAEKLCQKAELLL